MLSQFVQGFLFLLRALQNGLPNSLYPFVVKSLLAKPKCLGPVCVSNGGLGT